jgi:hypothetical protein
MEKLKPSNETETAILEAQNILKEFNLSGEITPINTKDSDTGVILRVKWNDFCRLSGEMDPEFVYEDGSRSAIDVGDGNTDFWFSKNKVRILTNTNDFSSNPIIKNLDKNLHTIVFDPVVGIKVEKIKTS